jgi:hypothetical protein
VADAFAGASNASAAMIPMIATIGRSCLARRRHPGTLGAHGELFV